MIISVPIRISGTEAEAFQINRGEMTMKKNRDNTIPTVKYFTRFIKISCISKIHIYMFQFYRRDMQKT